MLILTEFFQKHELDKVSKYFGVKDIQTSIKKIPIAGIEMSNLGYKDCKIIKIRIGHKPVGRMIVYLQTKDNYFIPLILRLKKDKLIGENLSLNNKLAEEKIIYNLEMIFKDLKNGKYRKLPL